MSNQNSATAREAAEQHLVAYMLANYATVSDHLKLGFAIVLRDYGQAAPQAPA